MCQFSLAWKTGYHDTAFSQKGTVKVATAPYLTSLRAVCVLMSFRKAFPNVVCVEVIASPFLIFQLTMGVK